VRRPGLLASVQDLGRSGLGHFGARPCGAADAGSLRLANRLVCNPDGVAGIEVTLGRAACRCAAPAWLAVTGAPVAVSVSAAGGQPGAQTGFGAAFWVPAGAVVELGVPAAGLRTHVAVRGGIDVPAVLGSQSADLVPGAWPAAAAGGRRSAGRECAGGRRRAARTRHAGRRRHGQPFGRQAARDQAAGG
jgi:allophanate hydrolase subunit 2